MLSRSIERFGLTLLLSLWLNAAAFAESIKILVQSSPLAGSQYYGAKRLRSEIRVGDRLTLTREADNRHDRNAVRVDWNGEKLGYVPRMDNAAASHLLDAGHVLQAEVVTLRESDNPWSRVEFAIFLADLGAEHDG